MKTLEIILMILKTILKNVTLKSIGELIGEHLMTPKVKRVVGIIIAIIALACFSLLMIKQIIT